jgi:hypothetical protein
LLGRSADRLLRLDVSDLPTSQSAREIADWFDTSRS